MKREDVKLGMHVQYKGPPKEDGVITSWSPGWCFVRYGDEELSKATRWEDLTVTFIPAREDK